MNLSRIVREKGLAFLEGIQKLRIKVVKRLIPSFFTEMVVPIKQGEYSFNFAIMTFTEGDKTYVSCYSLHEFMCEVAEEVDIFPTPPANRVIEQLAGKFEFACGLYGHSKAKWLLDEYLSNEGCVTTCRQLSTFFLVIYRLADVNTYLTSLGVGLNGYNIRQDVERFISDACGISDASVPLTCILVRKYTYRSQKKIVQNLRNKITHMQEANKGVLDILAGNHVRAIAEISMRLECAMTEIDFLRSMKDRHSS